MCVIVIYLLFVKKWWNCGWRWDNNNTIQRFLAYIVFSFFNKYQIIIIRIIYFQWTFFLYTSIFPFVFQNDLSLDRGLWQLQTPLRTKNISLVIRLKGYSRERLSNFTKLSLLAYDTQNFTLAFEGEMFQFIHSTYSAHLYTQCWNS